MKKIGILSDTHGYLHPDAFEFFKDCDEIWHAGDIMDDFILDELAAIAPTVRAVYGNCDDWDIRREIPENQIFTCEEHTVAIRHIVGYPGKYQPEALRLIKEAKPTIFVAGHSHILKVMFDKTHNLLFINPGAAGRYGIHTRLTMLRLQINGKDITNLELFDEPKLQTVK
ncbi:MAG: YfcE family phosphodiesterase [Bacteroidales bacterium]|nr:YfcE family phosphodiesterase [Bacteroidales bacterium]